MERNEEDRVLQLVHSGSASDRAQFLRAPTCSVGAMLVYNEVLSQETFRKLIFYVDGTCAPTTAPVSCVLPEGWKWWKLGEAGLMVGYDPRARDLNLWWAKMRDACAQLAPKVKHMYGDLVLFRWCKQVDWQELEAKRELMNHFISRYRYGRAYKFCWHSYQSDGSMAE